MGALERKPGGPDNWVEKVGGLPAYIERIAKSLHEKRGFTISRSIATAVSMCKRWAAGGEDVNPDTRAKAAKAVAEWEAKKARAHVDMSNLDVGGIDLAAMSDEDALDLAYGDHRPPYDWKHGYLPISPQAVRIKAKKEAAPRGNRGGSSTATVASRSIKKAAAAKKTTAPKRKPAVAGRPAERTPAQRKAADDAQRGRGVPGADTGSSSRDIPAVKSPAMRAADRRETDRADAYRRASAADAPAADRRAQDRAIERKDYANADGPALADEVARRGIMGRERAGGKSDSQLRTALRDHDKNPSASNKDNARARASAGRSAGSSSTGQTTKPAGPGEQRVPGQAPSTIADRSPNPREGRGGTREREARMATDERNAQAIRDNQLTMGRDDLERILNNPESGPAAKAAAKAALEKRDQHANRITPDTARRMSDAQLEATLDRLAAAGDYSSPAFKAVEAEQTRRDDTRSSAEGNRPRR